MTNQRTLVNTAFALAMFPLMACGTSENLVPDSPIPDSAIPLPENTATAIADYARIAHKSYSTAHLTTTSLQQSFAIFAVSPNPVSWSLPRDSWDQTRRRYPQTEVYRFYGGPIDDPTTGNEHLINAWRINEAYIDYVDGMPTAGIVSDTSITINRENLLSLHQQGDEHNISVGYHAIEFLLWGQDDPTNAGRGDRPPSDFYGNDVNTRRALYMTTALELLSEHLEAVVAAWNDGGDNYRSDFVALSPHDGMRRILTGLIGLTRELRHDRLQAPLDSGDQIDEHDRFGNQTHQVVIQNIAGLQNVWEGQYIVGTQDNLFGTGVSDVIAELDVNLAASVTEKIEACMTLASALEYPFDHEIKPDNPEGNMRVQAVIDALDDLESSLKDVFAVVGLTVPDGE